MELKLLKPKQDTQGNWQISSLIATDDKSTYEIRTVYENLTYCTKVYPINSQDKSMDYLFGKYLRSQSAMQQSKDELLEQHQISLRFFQEQQQAKKHCTF